MPIRAGKLRPSQAVTQFGPGSMVDLPTMSMIIAGADEWNLGKSRKIDEPRLARRLQVDLFREPPWYSAKEGIGGIPARIFPRFLVCPRCNRLALHESFDFNARRSEHVCKAPACRGRGRAVAYPARFIVACPRGHIADFPWHDYVHEPGTGCREELVLEDSGKTGSISDLWIKCKVHDQVKNLGQAFGREGRKRLPLCDGGRPWLGDHDPKGCGEDLRVLLRGASNAYFPLTESAISIPPWSDPIHVALGMYFDQMAKVDSLEKVQAWLDINNAPDLEEFPAEQIWDALQRRRSGDEAPEEDLRAQEWRSFQSTPGTIDERAEFRSKAAHVPTGFEGFISRVVLLERLREVRALRGFTRIDPIPDIGQMDDVEVVEVRVARVMKNRDARWLPGVDLRGEGLFIQFDEERIRHWESTSAVRDVAEHHRRAQIDWHKARDIEFRLERPPRYILLHSLAHILIRQLALESGYSSASLRERIYSSAEDKEPMAGVLIYTATPDSEGSLGGLVEMGRPENLGPMLGRALEESRLCANDPLCADREPTATGHDLNGAACHACLLLSETACEAGNHYLDRGMVVETLRHGGTGFYSG